jgi:hypothetical protein
MTRYTLIQLEINRYNGFIFSLFYVECEWSDTDSALFGLYFGKNFLYLDIFYKTFKIFDKTDK